MSALLIASGIVASGIFGAYTSAFTIAFSKGPVALREGFTVTAHSGSEGTPDNSLECIRKAAEVGADIAEIDLNLYEGVPVLSHDKGGGVTFDEAMETASQTSLDINIDLKDAKALPYVEPILEKYGMIGRAFFTGVFFEQTDDVKKYCPRVPFWVSDELPFGMQNSKKYLAGLADKIKASGSVGFNFSYTVLTRAVVAAMREKGLLISVWTVDGYYNMCRVLSFEPDNITTRKPIMLKAIIND